MLRRPKHSKIEVVSLEEEEEEEGGEEEEEENWRRLRAPVV